MGHNIGHMGLSVRDLSVARGGVTVLSGVSFDVAKGQALILRGPNGVGKTSLLRTLAGLQPALAGEVVVDPDQVIYAAHADGLKSMLTVTENLSFWAQIFGKTDISAALELFHLSPLADRMAGMLSAGQKRRLGLARLLVSGRAIWLLDEPTVSLDRDAVALFARAVTRHLQNGGIAIMATHIDLGLDATVLDLTSCRDRARQVMQADEAYL